MRRNGETCAIVVYDLVKDGKLEEDHPSGEIAGGNN